MLPHKHIIYGFLFSLLLVFIIPEIGLLGFIVIFLSSFLIDVDHYFASIITGNGLSLKKAFDWCIARSKTKIGKMQKTIIPFHGIEFFIFMFILLYFSCGILFWIILYCIIGCLFHMVLDLYDIIKNKTPLYVKLSFLYTMHRNYLNLKKTKTFKYQ